MDTPPESDERLDDEPFYRQFITKKALTILIGVLLVVAGAIWGIARLKVYRQDRLTQKAQHLYEQKDLRAAGMLLEQLLNENPENFTALRLLTKVIDETSPQEALIAWENLTKLQPGEPANLIGYAYAALRLGQHEKQAEILAELAKAPPPGPEYPRLLAASALARGDRESLKHSLTQLAQSEPANPLAQLNLAVLQLESQVPADVASARATLQTIASGKELRIRATLALIRDAPVRWPEVNIGKPPLTRLSEALGLNRSTNTGLRANPFTAQPLPVDWHLPALIAHMQAEPGRNPEDWATLAMWMNLVGQPREALLWLEGVEENQSPSPKVLAARATLTAELALWPKLEQLLVQQAWGDILPETVQLAFQARVAHENRDLVNAEQLWTNALRSAGYSLSSLRILYRLSFQWGWNQKRNQVLWTLTQHYPGYTLPWQRLLEHAFSTGDTAEVLRIYTAWGRALPDNVRVQGERLIIALLAPNPRRKLIAEAAELFAKAPEEPSCRIAQALALWRDNQPAAALQTLAMVPLAPGREPRFALAKGVILAANQRFEESERMFRLVPEERLLPEEIALMKNTRPPAQN